MARFRKSLVQVEKQKMETNEAVNPNTYSQIHNPAEQLEMTQVVMPPHQNHMGHTFGGVVMMWMAKAALVAASHRSGRPTDDLRINSILRVSFHVGSDVSDHLLFRPRIVAVFDEGRSVEVEVEVVKRAIKRGEEVSVNTGYFYVSRRHRKYELDYNIFACCLEEGIVNSHGSAVRKRSLENRMQLISAQPGNHAVSWHENLDNLAPILTLYSVLRLINQDDRHKGWKKVRIPTKTILHYIIHFIIHVFLYIKTLLGFTNATNSQPTPKHRTIPSDADVEWTTGAPWGRDTLLIRATATLDTDASIPDVLHALVHRHTEWDAVSTRIHTLEKGDMDVHQLVARARDRKEDIMGWDIVDVHAEVPVELRALFLLTKCTLASAPASVAHTLLRAWRYVDETDTAFYVYRSVKHPARSGGSSRVMPSGYVVQKDEGRIRVTYIGEYDMEQLRAIGGERRVLWKRAAIRAVQRVPWEWLEGLNSIKYGVDGKDKDV